MNIRELIEALEDYGDHVKVVIQNFHTERLHEVTDTDWFGNFVVITMGEKV